MSPVFLDLGAVFDRLIAPNIPAWSTSNLTGKISFYTNMELVIFVFHAGIFGNVPFNVLGCGYSKVDFVVVGGVRYQLFIKRRKCATIIVYYEEVFLVNKDVIREVLVQQDDQLIFVRIRANPHFWLKRVRPTKPGHCEVGDPNICFVHQRQLGIESNKCVIYKFRPSVGL